jgi:hypothetical protein
LKILVSPTGTTKKRTHREEQRDEHRAGPHAARDRLLVLLELGVGGQVERREADLERLDEGDDAADHRPAEDAVALGPGDERERLHVELPLWRADPDRPRRDAAHHHALEYRLPADRGVALRGDGRLGPAGLDAHVW